MKSKKTIVKVIGITMLSLFTVRAFCQEQQADYESKLTPKFGIKGGVNLSNFYKDDVDDAHMKVGGNFGVFAKIPVTKGFSIQPEVLYSMKGAQLNYDNAVMGTGKYKLNMDYIEVPVLAVFNVAKNINIQAGGYASYLVSAKVKDVDEDGNVNNTKELNKDDYNSMDYGLVGGVGFDISNFTIGARYNYGLKEIGKSDNVAGRIAQNAKNSAVSIYVGFAF